MPTSSKRASSHHPHDEQGRPTFNYEPGCACPKCDEQRAQAESYARWTFQRLGERYRGARGDEDRELYLLHGAGKALRNWEPHGEAE